MKTTRKRIFLSLLGFILIYYGKLFSQNNFPEGHLSISKYSAEEYNMQNQNFDVVQDERGIMYFANNGGLLEYDGRYWQNINVLEKQVFSLAKSKNGKIWIGSNGVFGSLSFDAKGKAVFLKCPGINAFPESEIGEIRNLLCTDERIYFFSKNSSIFIFEKDKLSRLKTEKPVQSAFVIDRQIVLQIEEQGVYGIEDKKIFTINNGTACGNYTIIAAIQKSDSVLLYNSEGECFVLKKTDRGVSLGTNSKNLNLQCRNIRDILMWHGKMIVATADNGVYTFNKSGKTIHHINKKIGLSNDKIEKLYLDKQQNLWLATADGVSKIDINSAVTYFDYLDGINGTIESICTLGKRLYIGTGAGLFYIENNSNEEHPKFKKVPELESEIWALYKIKTQRKEVLLVAENNAVYEVSDEGIISKITDCYPWSFHQLKNRPELILTAIEPTGFFSLTNASNKLIRNEILNPVDIPVKKIAEDIHGQLWMSGTQQDLYYVALNTNNNTCSVKKSRKFTFGDGSNLPRSTIYPEYVNNKVYFGTQRGFYFFDSTQNKFLPDNEFNNVFRGEGYSVHRFNQDKSGRIWLVAYDTVTQKKYFIGYGEKKKNKYNWANQPFLKISKNIIHAIYHDEEGLTWMGGPKGLYRFDPSNEFNSVYNYALHVRKILVGDEIYAHYYNPSDSSDIPTFAFSSTQFSFEFSAPNFFDEKNNQFSFYLEGLNEHWSEWQSQPIISYTNLLEGKYTLKVKARDIYGNESQIYSLFFKISPPWYRSWVAYLCYLFTLGVLIYGSIKLSIRRLRNANIKLEQIVQDRTKEIKDKNKTLEEQKNLVETQKNDIENKRKEIVDSINYASRLQQAIIPTPLNFRKILPESFILFKPKDIVSGDFYWISQQSDYILYVTADCTGHGVPGAFMSMLGTSLLNEIVNEKKIIEPADIINQLRERIIIALNQSGNVVENKDGMDMVIIRLNNDLSKMVYAAANNSFYIIRNQVILEQKADKMPVGYYGDSMYPFNQYVVDLMPGDFIYTFTDGYADQFGGPKGKKFKYKQMEEKMLHIVEEDVENQKLFLNEIFEKWKEGQEQIDDICIIGVRIVEQKKK
jgi:serine phosphatase RsbU (regulator of sigma subunit)/ligand-binding sensor domain-containing protein